VLLYFSPGTGLGSAVGNLSQEVGLALPTGAVGFLVVVFAKALPGELLGELVTPDLQGLHHEHAKEE